MQGNQINKGNQEQFAPRSAAGDAAPSNAPQQAQTQPIGHRRGLGSKSGNLMSRNPGSEVVSQLYKELEEIYSGVDGIKGLKLDLIPISYKDTRSLNSSFILIALSDPNEPKAGVGFHALILEDDSEIRTDITESYRNEQFPILKVAGDNVDEVMINYFIELVKGRYPQADVHYADACVIPTDFPITDKKIMFTLAANALNAAGTELAIHRRDFQYLNLAGSQKDNTLQVQVAYHQPEVIDAVGLPVRSDIVIDFKSVSLQSNQAYSDNQPRNADFSSVSGFLDLTYEPAVQMQHGMPLYQAYGQQQQQDPRLFSTRFVITEMASMDSNNIGDQVFALLTVLPLLENTQPWLQQLKPAHMVPGSFGARNAGFDPKDIGALNLAAGFKDKDGKIDAVNTSDPQTFGLEDFGFYVSRLIRPNLAVSIDVPETGPSTWYNRIFSSLADDSARTEIIRVLNALTGGKFGEIWAKTHGQFIINDQERIHLGYYRDEQGVKHDLRNIDLLYLMNRSGHNDPQIGQRWTESFRSEFRPPHVNLWERRRLIEEAVTPVYTGFARRVTLHPEFLIAIDQAFSAAGVSARIKSGGHDSAWPMRGYGNLAASGAMVDNFRSSSFGYGSGPNYSGQFRGGYVPKRF